MNPETKGAWIVHHGQKVRNDANGAAEFSALDTASKASVLLSQLAHSEQTTLSKSEVQAFAAAGGLNPRLEMDGVLSLLREQKLIDVSENGISVLGATSRSILRAASTIFDELSPSKEEKASIEIAELTSSAPQLASSVTGYVSDKFKIVATGASDLVRRSELIGFVDAEGSEADKLLFNGNLFRVAGPAKVAKVLSTLQPGEASKLRTFNKKLDAEGCILLTSAARELGEALMSKLRAIGLLDVSYVENEAGLTGFVTKPDAFHKFVDPIVDDAFDLAKALVAALSYGMHRSSTPRGQIWGIDLLLKKLIRGGKVGPAPAIEQDYRYLEHRGVVQVFSEGGSFSMRLLKNDIGEIALQVLTKGNASNSQVLEKLPSSPMGRYRTPEATRSAFRKTDRGKLKKTDQDILHVLRTRGAL